MKRESSLRAVPVAVPAARPERVPMACRGRTAAVHEWRKRAKYHWYHARLPADCWWPVTDAWRSDAHRLSEAAGDAHHLGGLRQAPARGRRLYAEQPSRLAARLDSYWMAWREAAPSRPDEGVAGDAAVSQSISSANAPSAAR